MCVQFWQLLCVHVCVYSQTRQCFYACWPFYKLACRLKLLISILIASLCSFHLLSLAHYNLIWKQIGMQQCMIIYYIYFHYIINIYKIYYIFILHIFLSVISCILKENLSSLLMLSASFFGPFCVCPTLSSVRDRRVNEETSHRESGKITEWE